MTNIIVATDKNNLIGNGNEIPWYIKEDLKLFREKTMGCPIVMGRNTWESIKTKSKKVFLDGRINIVISSDADKYNSDVFYDKNMFYGPVFEYDLTSAMKKAQNYANGKNDVFIIGGAQAYKEALDKDLVDRIYLSKVKGEYVGDKYFPKLENWREELVEKFEHFDFFLLTKETI